LLAHADAALYEAKRRGRDRVELFDPALRRRLVERLRLEDELHRSLAAHQLTLHWQPIVDAADGHIVAAEALLRWQHPSRGLLNAADFLPGATEVGLLPELATWSVSAAMQQAALWQRLPRSPEIFINLSADQMTRPALPAELAELAERHQVDPTRVHLELSENTLSTDIPALRVLLDRLRERGFRLALDDFGAGNTALTWLRHLPIDVLKLDRSFTATIDEAATNAVVRSILQLAKVLGIRSVAEGVETPDQLVAVTAAGCDYTQGYHLARPAPAAALLDLAGTRPLA
jgi:EAL domain-containing protein (putative c-di-GMP-specific phosphodiesterase class I)